MFLDQILILVGTVSLVIFLCLMLYLIISRKKSRLYKEILDKETEAFDTLSATFGHTRSSMSIRVEDTSDGFIDATLIEDAENTVLAEARPDGETPFKTVHDFSPAVLSGLYEILGEIEGGGMSRVFLARKTSIGNEWIIKYVPTAIGELTNEAEILKALNHINLPSIIDIFSDDTGLYIVQSYISGMGLNRVLRSNAGIHEFVVLDWAEQLTQVLSYLHKQSVLHLDLKPSNIIVTHDNKLVLIDFGISRWQADAADSIGATVSYAAPEQLKKIGSRAKAIVQKRFGDTLPAERVNWGLDERTDIYSFGIIMFEAAVGHIATIETAHRLKNHLSPGFCDIIYKCLAVNPAERFQSTEELLSAIQKQQSVSKPNMLKTLIARKASKVAAAAALVVAAFGLSYGFHTMSMELQATMGISPQIISVSLAQSSEVQITQILPNGNERTLDSAHLSWNFDGNIAQVDGNRVIGLNVGETEIHGTYRNAEITMYVTVVEPMDGMVDISLRYQAGGEVRIFAGGAYREHIDGVLSGAGGARFVSPGSMARAASGAIYIADAGVLRRMYGDAIETIELYPPFLRPHIVRTSGDDLYVLTSPWQDGEEFFYGIIRITESGGEGFFLGDARNTDVRDFYVANGLIYFIERNEGTMRTHLRTICTQNPENIRTLSELSEGASALAISSCGERVYIADADTGVLVFFEGGELSNFAGAAGENAFIDGPAPLFYRPTRLKYHAGGLYVWDFNVLRRIDVQYGLAREVRTIAGAASPIYAMEFAESEAAEIFIFPHSVLADFVLANEFGDDGTILVSDSKRGVVWAVEFAS